MRTIICIALTLLMITPMANAQTKIKQTAGREQLGDFAPKFAELNDDVLFGEVWSRTDKLGLRDRSMVTITALVSSGITDSSLTYHLQTARKNGITRTEIAEILTQVGFYAGWPKAWAAFRLAKDVWTEETEAADEKAKFEREMIFPIGKPNDAYARYFIGQSYLAPVSSEQVGINNVTFEPGCRNNWHIHHATKGGGQLLVCVAGTGWYQEWGKPARLLRPGDVVNIPAGIKHWHGATADSWFAHLAIEVPGEKTSNEWLEPVTDEEYNKLQEEEYQIETGPVRDAHLFLPAYRRDAWQMHPAGQGISGKDQLQTVKEYVEENNIAYGHIRLHDRKRGGAGHRGCALPQYPTVLSGGFGEARCRDGRRLSSSGMGCRCAFEVHG